MYKDTGESGLRFTLKHMLHLKSQETTVFILTDIKDSFLDFSDGPVAESPRSQCKGPRLNPWTAN